jgi:hypothetical protein
MKKIILMLCLFLLVGCHSKPSSHIKDRIHYNSEMGILTGMKKDQLMKIKKKYNRLVASSKGLSKEDLAFLRKHANKLYAKIDMRKDRNKVEGFDGYFLTHTEDYSYDEVVSTIKSLNSSIIIHNGKNFVLKLIKNKQTSLIEAISQESVFTSSKKGLKTRVPTSKKKSDALKDYLAVAKKNKLEVFVIEFTKKSDWIAVMNAYCKHRDYHAMQVKKANYSKE